MKYIKRFLQKGDGKIIYKIFISKRARKAINSHIEFLARINIEASQKLFNKFLEKISSLDFMPTRGQILKAFNKNIRKLVINKRFLILYSIVKEDIHIYSIVDTRRNNKTLEKSS